MSSSGDTAFLLLSAFDRFVFPDPAMASGNTQDQRVG
jgi:hypothetical protein